MLRALEREDLPTAIANRFKVTQVWLYRMRTRRRQTGQPGSLPRGPPTVTVGRDGADASGLAQGKRRSHVRGAVCTPSATGLQSNRPRCGIKSTNGCTPASKRAPT